MKTISNPVLAACCAFAFTLIVGGLLSIPVFQSLEDKAGDEITSLRYALQKDSPAHKPDSRLVLAAIDELSTRKLGAWPFPRSVHGQFLDTLAPEKPNTVAWDILFTESKTLNQGEPLPGTGGAAPDATATAPPPTPTDDDSLVEGVSKFPHLISGAQRSDDPHPALNPADILPTRSLKNVTGDLSQILSSKYATVPFPALRKQSTFGFVDEPGDIRRKMPLIVNVNGDIFPSFDLQVLMQFWNVDPDQVAVRVGRDITITKPDHTQAIIPIDPTGQITLNYRARLEDFQSMSYVLMGIALDDKMQNAATARDDHLVPLTDRILVVGVTFSGYDAGPTPLDPTAPLVVTHLNALNNILQHDFLIPLSGWIWMPLYALFLFGLALAMLRVGILPMILIAAGGMIFLALAVFGALLLGNVQVPVGMPEVGLLLLAIAVPSHGFFGEGREKARIKAAMSACLSEKVMVKMLEHPDNVKLGGLKQEITVMFCDIRGFTAYCDQRDSQEVLDVLNEYMEVMTQVVFKYDGTIDKYIGDCIMAFWNAPQPQPDHAQRAVCCAMEMRYALAGFKTQRAGLDHELFECGIGIHTGEALVGMMGSSIKRNYTTMGSTVNLAARLESLTKRLNERILISQEVLDQLQGDFPLTDRGEALVPGFTKPVHVYAVVADQDISSALKVGRRLAEDLAYKADDVQEPMWEPAPLPEHSDPGS